MRKKNKINLFDAVPLIGPSILSEIEEERIVISFPRFRNAFLQKYIAPRSKSRRLHVYLDAYGTAVWQQIDGKKNVLQIVESLAEFFKEEADYEVRITAFITQLQANGFITLGLPV